jgi:hypothetical protein
MLIALVAAATIAAGAPALANLVRGWFPDTRPVPRVIIDAGGERSAVLRATLTTRDGEHAQLFSARSRDGLDMLTLRIGRISGSSNGVPDGHAIVAARLCCTRRGSSLWFGHGPPAATRIVAAFRDGGWLEAPARRGWFIIEMGWRRARWKHGLVSLTAIGARGARLATAAEVSSP